jgi:hypothetical protein
VNRLYAFLVTGPAIGGALFAVILFRSPEATRQELVVDVAKATIGLFPVAFLSVVVAELVKRRDLEGLVLTGLAPEHQAR